MSLPTTIHDLPRTQRQPQSNSITVTFTQLFSLLGALLTIKLYHGLSTLSRGRKPTRHSIEQTEDHIVALFQAIVPEALYRMDSKGSGVRSGATSRRSFPYDSDWNGNGARARSVVSASTRGSRQRRGQGQGYGVIDPSTATTEALAHSPLMKVTSNIAPAIRMSQCLSRMSGERAFELVRTVTAGTTRTENIPEISLEGNSHGHGHGHHLPDTSLTSCQAQYGSVSSIAATITPPVSASSTYKPYRPGALSSSILACPPPHNSPESLTPTTSNRERSIHKPEPLEPRFMGRLSVEVDESWPRLEEEESETSGESEVIEISPTDKGKWPQFEQEESPTEENNGGESPIYDAHRVESESESDTGVGGGLRLVRSAESYPGRFPVSDGLPLAALATAPICVRGKAKTSVRPLSDM